MNKMNIDNLISMCNAVKATNDYPPTLLVSRLTYEQHKDWFDGLGDNVCIIKPMAELKQDDKIWIVPHDYEERYFFE